MALDEQNFRAGMRMLAGGVTIITTRHEDRRSGLTATAVCSLSASPPRLLACVNLKGATFQLISQSRRMTINVLRHGHEFLARRFAGQLGIEGEDPFRHGDWNEDGGRAPHLTDALASFDCHVEEMLMAHTHAVIFGNVAGVQVGAVPAGSPASPLIYADGMFGTISSPPPTISQMLAAAS